MKAFDLFGEFLCRLRYPLSQPCDVLNALGIEECNPNALTFEELLGVLTHPRSHPKNIKRFMNRDEAESLFTNCLHIDHFSDRSLYSFRFKEGWVECILTFDGQSRLRRLYINHKGVADDHGCEIPLEVAATA